MNILQVNSSARTSGSQSTRLADDIAARLLAANPQARRIVRNLAAEPLPDQDETMLQALATPPEQRTAAQQARVAHDDALIAEVQQADVIVLGVPMYNFGVPAQLKHWIDAIARAGVTFRYSENGPEGLLRGKKVYVALTRGGMHKDQPSDTIPQYLKVVLGFLGMHDVQMFFAEGLAYGPEPAQRAMHEAQTAIAAAIA